MSNLFENYIEATLLHNEELHDQARREHNLYDQQATVVGRVVSQIIHGRMLILDVNQSVMELVQGKIVTRTQGGSPLPEQALAPACPPQPLFIDLLEARVARTEWPYPPIAGMVFECKSDPDIQCEAKSLLPTKYHPIIEEHRTEAEEHWAKQPGVTIQRMPFPQPLWAFHCIDEWGEEILSYIYEYYNDDWSWQIDGNHSCPYGKCRYSPIRTLLEQCIWCERDQALMVTYFGMILLYDAGFYQEVVVHEEEEEHTYTINPNGRTPQESEVTRSVKVRRLRKNVLVKELVVHKPVVQPRGSWKEKHNPDEILVQRKKRRPYDTRTRSGKIIHVVPTQKKNIPMLKVNASARTEIELFAASPATQSNRPNEEDHDSPIG